MFDFLCFISYILRKFIKLAALYAMWGEWASTNKKLTGQSVNHVHPCNELTSVYISVLIFVYLCFRCCRGLISGRCSFCSFYLFFVLGEIKAKINKKCPVHFFLEVHPLLSMPPSSLSSAPNSDPFCLHHLVSLQLFVCPLSLMHFFDLPLDSQHSCTVHPF